MNLHREAVKWLELIKYGLHKVLFNTYKQSTTFLKKDKSPSLENWID